MSSSKTESKYHLYGEKFDNFNFNTLFKSQDPKNIKILKKIGGKTAPNYNVGDKCFIYFADLPDGTDRILLSSTVIDSDTDRENREKERYSYEKDEKIKGMWLSDIRVIALNDRGKFDNQALGRYDIKNPLQQHYLCPTHQQHLELIEKLEKETIKETLEDMEEYFNRHIKCFFSGKNENEHKLFTNARGVKFCEKHHVVLKSYEQVEGKLRDNKANLIYLCPCCHKQIHHGKAEAVRNMIHLIYNSNAVWFDESFKEYAKTDGEDDVERWIMSIYDLQRKHDKYETIL